MRHPYRVAFTLWLLFALTACASRVVRPPEDGTPEVIEWRAPATPVALIDTLEAAWRSMQIETYTQLFDSAYVFRRAPNDTGPWRQIHREPELMAADAIFNGAPGRPRATAIELERVADLAEGPDPRPGKNSRWHRLVTASYDLTVQSPERILHASSVVSFFVVRGDSARIPFDLEELGVRPDSTRWYVERWDEIGPAFRTPPTVSWAYIKQIYLPPPPRRSAELRGAELSLE